MVRKTVLDNGLRLLSRRLEGTRAVSLGIWIDSGSRDEPESKEGITHFLEHMFFKGTRRRSTHDIAVELDLLGGHSNAYTTKEYLCFYAKVLNTHLPKLLDIFFDILLDSTMDENELEKERFVILQEIKMVDDSPEDCIHSLLCEKFWQGNPLGHPVCGYRDSIGRLTRSDLLQFKDSLLHPGQIVLAAAGAIDHDELVSWVAPVLGTLKENGRGRPERVRPDHTVFREAVCRELEQTHFCLAMPGVSFRDEDRFAVYLANTIFGSSMSSRLFQEIRERRGLAYSVYSFVNCYEDTGMFGIYAAVSPENLGETFNVVISELETLVERGVSQEELKRAKDCVIGNMYLNLDSTDAHMSRIARNELLYGCNVRPEEIEKKVQQVTAEDIQRYLRHSYQRDCLSVLILGSDADNALQSVTRNLF
ncbi:MAG: insulinase family protein [Deltaproteobacteria bacterium]|nr:insulinase family protein [Deltaproteobacteria bacterium]MBW2068379.1 insulinase family protein [Deltaproteobacteria bacterium]